MDAMASQITSLTIVYSSVYSGTDERKHQSSASLAFVRGNHRWPVNSPHKEPVTRKMFPFDDVIILWTPSSPSTPWHPSRSLFLSPPPSTGLGLFQLAFILLKEAQEGTHNIDKLNSYQNFPHWPRLCFISYSVLYHSVVVEISSVGGIFDCGVHLVIGCNFIECWLKKQWKSSIWNSYKHLVNYAQVLCFLYPGSLLLAWINFNYSMDK